MTKKLEWVMVNGMPKSKAIVHLEDDKDTERFWPLCGNPRWFKLTSIVQDVTCPKCLRKRRRSHGRSKGKGPKAAVLHHDR